VPPLRLLRPRLLRLAVFVVPSLLVAANAHADETASATTPVLSPTAPTATTSPAGVDDAPAPASGDRPSRAETYLKNEGRGWAWLYGGLELGASHTAFNVLQADNAFIGGVKPSTSGPLLGGTLGARLSLFSIGLRSRVMLTSEYQALTVGPEIGLHFPIGKSGWEPNLSLGIHYTRLFGIDIEQPPGATYIATGIAVRGALGVDRWVSPHVTIGGLLSGELYALTRPETVILAHSASTTKDPTVAVAAARSAEGSSVGLGASFTVQAAYHF
jgi:hypothetical protein